MSRYLLRRLAQMLPIALLVATLVFSLLHLIPGDPVEVMLGEGAQAADVAALRAELGLDRPLGEQYLAFLGGLGRFDLGTSLHSGEPVTAVLLAHLPATLELACAAMLVALALSLPLGTLAAFHRGRAADHVSRAVAVLGVALPNFWLGPMLILLFSVQLGWLPVSGREGVASLVLPAVTLGAGLSALLTRLVRASVAEELGRPYLATALAKGVSRARAVVVHALRNALVPALTVAALQFGALLTGAIVTETVFSWPGLGRLLIEGIRLRDYPLVQGGVLLIAWTYLVVNLTTDLAYAWLDPRMRENN